MSESVNSISRRGALTLAACAAAGGIASVQASASQELENSASKSSAGGPEGDLSQADKGPSEALRVHYLEIVTEDVEAVCSLYSEMLGLTFGAADRHLGGARTVQLAGGSLLGVRAPMHAGEKPVVRPYALVKDLAAAIAKAEKAGAEIAVPSMAIPNHGTCAIYFLGGIEFGLWQV